MVSKLVLASDYPLKIIVHWSPVVVMNTVTKCRLGRGQGSFHNPLFNPSWREGRTGSRGRCPEAGTWGQELKQGSAGLLTFLLNSDILGIMGRGTYSRTSLKMELAGGEGLTLSTSVFGVQDPVSLLQRGCYRKISDLLRGLGKKKRERERARKKEN